MGLEALAEPESAQPRGPDARPHGALLVHDVCLVLPDWRAWELACRSVLEAGGEIEAVRLTRRPEGYTARCRLGGLTESAALALTERLCARRVAKCTGLEHLIVATGRL